MKPELIILGMLLCCAVLGAACGELGNESSGAQEESEAPRTATTVEETTGSLETEATEPPASEPPATEPSTTEEAGEVVVVTMRGLEYVPSRVEVSPGTTVRWVNEDSADHTVTSEEAGGPLASDVFGQGGSFEYTFDEPGEFAYFCEVHPFMKAVVIVG